MHSVSVVVPVYRGETTIPALVADLARYTTPHPLANGDEFVVTEVVLVHDNGPDRSDLTITAMEQQYDFVRPVWLSRNFGQDAATIAGMAATSGQWIATLDEDGQHDPEFLDDFLETALRERADLVYSLAVNKPPHSFLRNLTSVGAKKVLSVLFDFPSSMEFQSFRLIRGDVGRKLADITSSGTYLDVALTWVTRKTVTCPVTLRQETRETSGYNYKSLFALFWKMVLCSGTRGLRFVSVLGLLLTLVGLAYAGWVVFGKLTGSGEPEGWTSLVVIMLVCTGAILLSLGMIAEYLGVALHVLIGRPLYLRVDSPFPAGERREAS